jgi:hypothetical protein
VWCIVCSASRSTPCTCAAATAAAAAADAAPRAVHARAKQATLPLRVPARSVCARHRLPLRPRPRNAHRGHGGNGRGCQAGRVDAQGGPHTGDSTQVRVCVCVRARVCARACVCARVVMWCARGAACTPMLFAPCRH